MIEEAARAPKKALALTLGDRVRPCRILSRRHVHRVSELEMFALGPLICRGHLCVVLEEAVLRPGRDGRAVSCRHSPSEDTATLEFGDDRQSEPAGHLTPMRRSVLMQAD